MEVLEIEVRSCELISSVFGAKVRFSLDLLSTALIFPLTLLHKPFFCSYEGRGCLFFVFWHYCELGF